MLTIAWIFWYCYDDWLAGITAPWVGEINFFVWFLVLLFSGVTVRGSDD